MKNLLTPLVATGLLLVTAPRGLAAQELVSAKWQSLNEGRNLPRAEIMDLQEIESQWGTSDPVVYHLNAYDFGEALGMGTDLGDGTYRWITGQGDFFAGARLPTGARISDLAVVGCDSSTEATLAFALFGIALDGTNLLLAHAETGATEAPGCNVFGIPLPTPETVKNNALSYQVGVTTFGAGEMGAARFLSATLVYELQVSPAPATATFSDVPTSHLFFQYIEALARSGITSGCGNNKFCPNAPLTRGQMAAFLAKALGLHWPN